MPDRVRLTIAAAAAFALAAYIGLGSRSEGPETAALNGALLFDHQLVSVASGNDEQPALSPDGSRVAYVRDDENGVAQIWVQSMALGNPRQLTFTMRRKSTPSWSAANRILFTVHRSDGPPIEVRWIDELGTLEPGLLINIGGNATYSFDGESIVFERGKEIWLADKNGNNQRRVDGVPERDWVTEWMWPALSPDGETIAFFMQAIGPVGDIWLIPSGGGTARPLTRERQHIGRPAWSADGRHVYFSSRRGGTWNLWRVAVATGDYEQVTSGVGEDRHPALSRDGSTVVYQNTRTSTTFVVTDPATGRSESIGSAGSLSWFANVSHDGRRFAYFAEVAPREQIFVMNVDGTGNRQLTFGDGGLKCSEKSGRSSIGGPAGSLRSRRGCAKRERGERPTQSNGAGAFLGLQSAGAPPTAAGLSSARRCLRVPS